MTTLIYIFLFIVIWHFLYEGVIAPALRHGLRYKFFNLRDELRNLSIQGLSKNDQKIFQNLDYAICGIIESMSFISIGNYYLLKKHHKVRKEELKKFKALLKSADNSQLQEINNKMGDLGAQALIINNGAWTIYLVAPLLLILFVAQFFRQFDKLSKTVIKVSSRLIFSQDQADNTTIRLA